MDIEFHYYMTYLIAARAGFSPQDAAVIAQAAQEIDDNHIPIEVSAGTPYAFTSTLSQTMDILHPRHNTKIYPVFHFIPGDQDAPSAKRNDGRKSPWVTTPNSGLANDMLDTALKSKDLYRIGASAHAYADTWAHQNFLGVEDNFNDMPYDPSKGILENAMNLVTPLKIGHAIAQHLPDIPGLIWNDGRLAEPVVINSARFLDAANHLFRKLFAYNNAGSTGKNVDVEAAALLADLQADIGPSSQGSIANDPARIERYKKRALTSQYGGAALETYVLGKWTDAAFVEQRTDIAQQLALYMAENVNLIGDVLDFGVRMPCTWKDPPNYRKTTWYKFQNAVNSHLNECWGLLVKQIPAAAEMV
jgi:hypothetical protein